MKFKDYKKNWNKYLDHSSSRFYSGLILENQQYLDEDITDTLKNVFQGGKSLTLKTLFPILYLNDLADLLEKSDVATEVAHFTLDAAGLVPIIGEVADGLNVAWYAKEGEWFNAAMSLLSILPVAGDIIGKGAKYLGKGSKPFAKFISKYGDDIAKAWKKIDFEDVKQKLSKLVEFFGGEEEFDNAIEKMKNAVTETLNLQQEAKKTSAESAKKVSENKKLQQNIIQKIMNKKGAESQVALQELQQSYHGIEDSTRASGYEYTGYSSAIDSDGSGSSGSSDFQIDEIKQGRNNWKKMVENDQIWRTLLESEQTERILKSFADINEKIKSGDVSKDEAENIIQQLVQIDAELKDISEKAKHEVTFSNVAVGPWSSIVSTLTNMKDDLSQEARASLDYLIARNGKGIQQRTQEIETEMKKQDKEFLVRVGYIMSKYMDDQVKSYLMNALKHSMLIRRFILGFNFGMGTDVARKFMKSNKLTQNDFDKKLDFQKENVDANVYEIGEFLGSIISEQFEDKIYKRLKYPSGEISQLTFNEKLKDIMGVDYKERGIQLSPDQRKMIGYSLILGMR